MLWVSMTLVMLSYDLRKYFYSNGKLKLSKEIELARIDVLQQMLLWFTLLNFFIVASIGVLLRAVPVFGPFYLSYQNILHGHSHFAFGGWVSPLLVWMILSAFPNLKRGIRFVHWRNVILILLVSAYGMLLTFPFQGYAPASILFSTLSMAGTFYLSFILWKALRFQQNTSSLLLKGAAFFLVISSIGPLATIPIISSGNGGTPLYYNAIYTYLHFQYNGWFMFAIMAILYKRLEKEELNRSGNFVYVTMFIGCLLTLPLSFLWSNPGVIYNIVGATGVVVQITGVILFLKDQIRLKERDQFVRKMHAVVFTVLVIKCILQLLTAVPDMAGFVYSNRALIIAYLHMVLLGFVSLFGLVTIYRSQSCRKRMKVPLYGFLFAFVTTEIVQIINAFSGFTGFYLPYANGILLGLSILLPLSALYVFAATWFNVSSKSYLSEFKTIYSQSRKSIY
jgi:hypothetical protein